MRKKNKIQAKGNNAVAILTDGETEKWYFQLLSQEEGLRLPITYYHPKGTLQEMYGVVKEYCNRPFVKVFWIIDFDVISKEERERVNGASSPIDCFRNILNDMKPESKKYPNLFIFINNPCFEFWHLLHFKETSRYYPMYEPELRKDLEKVLPNYDKTERFYKTGTNIYVRLKPLQNDALNRSSMLPRFDIDNYQRANAGVYELVKELLDK